MATIPRKFIMTSRAELHNIDPISGQIIGLWDNDEVYYDVPSDGTPDGRPVVRRKISGVRIVTSLPEDPMTDIIYVYIGDHGVSPSGEPLYDLRIWKDQTWYIVATNSDDANVMTEVSDDKFYLVGTDESADESVGTLLKNTGVYVQSGELHGTLRGTADNADQAASANLATRAINDNAASPKAITGYIHDLASNATSNLGSTITITKGDGTTSTIRVSDTKYNVYTSNTAGLVPGTNTTVPSDNTNLLLCGSGWIDKDNYVMPAADSASKDGLGQNIADTYIKGLSWSNGTLSITAGDGDISTISVPDTTYSVFTTSIDGLVPKASGSGASGKFLRGDATWQSAITPSDIFAGTTAGLVPSSTSGVNEKFLRSDGSWFGTFDNDEDGLVPKTGQAQTSDVLHANGTWGAEIDTKNTAGATQEDSTQQASPLYIIGAETQTANPQTYSEALVYILGGKLYQSDGAGTPSAVQVVDLTSSQVLENKQFKISGTNYSVGTAVSKSAATSISNTDASVPTNAAVINYVSSQIGSVQTSVNNRVPNASVADLYDATSTYAVGDYVMFDVNDTGNAVLYKCNTAISTPEAFDPTKWDDMTIMQAVTGTVLVGTLTAGSTSITLSDASITTNSHIEVWAENGNVNYTNISSTTGSVTITFLAQASNMTVEVRVF